MKNATSIDNPSMASRILFAGAQRLAGPLGGNSCFRKFVRRNRGKSYQVETVRGFYFAGEIGDSVDNQIAIYRDYEPALSGFIASRANGTKAFLDIGSNVGWFSCLVSSLEKPPQHIVTVDANPLMVEASRRNLAQNGFAAECMARALGPENGSITLHIPERRHSRASIGLGNAAHFGDTRAIEVEMVLLDDLLFRFPDGRCDMIKMDIEGYELEALRTVPTDVILRVGTLVLEYTQANLEGCGFGGMTLGVLPWLDHFSVLALDNDGKLEAVANPADFRPRETTFILNNRTWT